MERVSMPAIPCDVTVVPPRACDVEVFADQRETARNMQGMSFRRRIKQQRMVPENLAFIREHTDVVEAVPALTAVADPPHDSPASLPPDYALSSFL